MLARGQEAKGFIPAPAIDFEISVERENLGGLELIGEANQTGIREVDSLVAIFAKDLLDARSFLRELKGNKEDASGDILDDCFGRARQMPQQVATLGSHSFTGNKGRLKSRNSRSRGMVEFLAPVEERDDNARIEQNGFHRPKFRRCF